MKGEGEGEGNTGRQSSVLEQLNRGRAARDGCSMCGKTDGEAYMLKCRWSKQQGRGGGRAQHSVSVSRQEGQSWQKQQWRGGGGAGIVLVLVLVGTHNYMVSGQGDSKHVQSWPTESYPVQKTVQERQWHPGKAGGIGYAVQRCEGMQK